VLALAPDASSLRAAQLLASGRSWPRTGTADDSALWGECLGSAVTPYRTVVDLSGPAYRCSCPSRKFPCKHAVALMLLWSDGTVGTNGGPPDWAASWLAARSAKASDPKEPKAPADPAAALRRAEQREARVASGLTELDRWLCDQARQGLAASQRYGYGHWDDIAARMIDAQAAGLAERLRALAAVPHSGPGWDGRLLEEYALLWLLAAAVSFVDGQLVVTPISVFLAGMIASAQNMVQNLNSGLSPAASHSNVMLPRPAARSRPRQYSRARWAPG